MNIINGIEIYNITKSARKYYRDNAKRGSSATNEVIRRKMTALILNSYKTKINNKNYKYTFNAFNIIVDEKSKLITEVYWSTENNVGRWLDNKEVAGLVTTYQKLGLSNSGNTIVE